MLAQVVTVILLLALILLLLFLEYRRHDMQANPACLGSAPPPKETDPLPLYLKKVIRQVETCDEMVQWRRALIVGILAAFVIIFFLKRRFPSAIEFLFVFGIIFILVYFANHWLQTHFMKHNVRAITSELNTLRDQALSGKIIQK